MVNLDEILANPQKYRETEEQRKKKEEEWMNQERF